MKKMIFEVFVCILLITTIVPVVSGAANWTEEQKLLPSDVKEGDSVNWLVSLDGDTALLGASGVNNRFGAAYVFIRSGSTWTQQAMLQSSEIGSDRNFFGSSVSLSGNTALVGTYDAVYVFTRNGTTWTQQTKLLTSGTGYGSEGGSVSLDGDTALIGTTQEMAYVFTRTGTMWTQQATLEASDGDGSQHQFGKSVSLSGNTALIGAYWDPNDKGIECGSAYVFTRTGTTWTQQAKLVYPGDKANVAQFGWSVSLDGDTALIGAKADDSSYMTARGSTFVFTRTGTTWSQQQKLNASDGAANDYFGYSVSLDGNTALIGTFGYGIIGSAYVFTRTGTSWIQQQKLQASDRQAYHYDHFGITVSLSGDTALVGTAENTGGTDLNTKVYVFVQGGENQPPVATFTWTPSNPKANQTITFDASTSNDPDGSIVKYEWDWNNDSRYEDSHATATATHSWAQAGSYPVTLQVTDNDGATKTKTTTVTISAASANQTPDTSTKTPGFELVFVIGAIALSMLLLRKKRIV